MILDGKKIAEDILEGLDATGLVLGVVMDQGDAAARSFVAMKERAARRAGVELKRFSPEDIEQALTCDGVVVQLPIAAAGALIARIPPNKDVDALGQAPLVRPPVAEAVAEVLARAGVAVAGKKAVVVGEGRLVGVPVAHLLRESGAKVSVVSLEQGSLAQLKDADIVVLGAGSPGLIKPEMLKPGVVLIDAGTSDLGGVVVGDADPRCAEVASVFTPTPGGIGPIAVAMLFKNLAVLARGRHIG
jgi:methylenetetrahydrofolate dehydrogenase (NADP+)/methenyltetrahydrofolate cyclohydrolase